MKPGPFGSTYTINNVKETHNVVVTYETYSYTIDASAGAHGSISPLGTVTKDYGTSQTYAIAPDLHYQVADVLVDGVSVGPVTSYTFNSIAANHTIAASFSMITHTIAASAGTGGSIDPSGSVSVNDGADQALHGHGLSRLPRGDRAGGWPAGLT